MDPLLLLLRRQLHGDEAQGERGGQPPGYWAAPECAISGQRFLGFRLDFMCFDLFFKNKKKQRWILIFHYILSEKTDLKW